MPIHATSYPTAARGDTAVYSRPAPALAAMLASLEPPDPDPGSQPSDDNGRLAIAREW